MHGSHVRRLARIVAGSALLLLALVPAAIVVASPYPPNTVVSTYTDPRYCGGAITVMSDAGGNLIDVCSDNGQRIYPGTAPYGAPGYPGYPGYAPPFNNGYVPAFNGTVPFAPGYGGATYGPTGGAVIRQYTDNNSNCPNGDVTQTVGGFYCTANGAPAASNNSIPTYNGGYAPVFNNGYAPGYPGYAPAINGNVPFAPGYGGTAYNPAANGAVVRQYTDNNSNCPNGDVTQTVGGFYCTANGAPAARVA